MARIRSVHPDICGDEVMAVVTSYAERTFIRLWTHLDDKGRGVDNAKLWKGFLYPLHDDVTSERVERDLTELAACGLLIRYEVDGKRLLCAKPETWAKYQRPQHPTPSKLPPPPDKSGALMSPPPGVVGESSCTGEEGESEGEPPRSLSNTRPVDNPQARTLAARALLHANEPSGRPELSLVENNPATGATA